MIIYNSYLREFVYLLGFLAQIAGKPRTSVLIPPCAATAVTVDRDVYKQ